MALVTIQRTPSPSLEQDLDATDSSDDVTDGRTQMRKRSRTAKQKLRKIVSSMRFLSKLRPGLSQSYFTVKGAALILPHTDFTKKSVRKSHGGEIQQHLHAMLHLLRPEDTIKIAVRLEDTNLCQRYMALVSTKGRQDTEEAVILGIDCSSSQASIGLVLPVWMGLQITLGGDGGFSLHTDEQCYLFKPVSVQTMWSAIQSLVKVQHVADDMKYIRDGLSHTWVGYYKSRVDRRDSARVSQWNAEGVEVFAPSSLSAKSNDDESTKQMISHTLKDVMTTVDLDEATSMMLRKAVEDKMNMSLAEFKGYFDEEVMRILGQMDEPSEILDFLYLGSEWNASNLEELIGKGIDNILNVTKEIDNFFEGRFHYYNVRVYDEDHSDLLKHWDKTYKFISKARSQGSKVLVHCKMGVSRSASTVMAFMMKERRWSVQEAFTFVKERRNCVHPNAGFMEQLHMYEAILTASNKRDIFRSKSEQNLLDESAKDDLELPDMSFLGGDLFHMMSHSDWLSASEGVAPGEEWIGSLYQDELHDTDMLQVGTEMDTECRSADSMEEVLPDLPSPPPETAGHECLSLSIPSARPLCERSSGDSEVAQLSETGLGIPSGDTELAQLSETGLRIPSGDTEVAQLSETGLRIPSGDSEVAQLSETGLRIPSGDTELAQLSETGLAIPSGDSEVAQLSETGLAIPSGDTELAQLSETGLAIPSGDTELAQLSETGLGKPSGDTEVAQLSETGLAIPSGDTELAQLSETGLGIPSGDTEVAQLSETGVGIPSGDTEVAQLSETGLGKPSGDTEVAQLSETGLGIPSGDSEVAELSETGLRIPSGDTEVAQLSETGLRIPSGDTELAQLSETGLRIPSGDTEVAQLSETGLGIPSGDTELAQLSETGLGIPSGDTELAQLSETGLGIPSGDTELAQLSETGLGIPSGDTELAQLSETGLWRPSGDTELAQLSETGLGIPSDQSACSADDTQISVGSPTSRIKPDSSWIRLDIVDTEEESNNVLNSKFMYIESVPCSDSHSSNDLNAISTLDSSTIDSHIPASTDSEEAAVTEPHMAATQPLRAASTEPHVAASTEPYVTNTEHHRAASTEPHVAVITEPHVAATQPQRAATDLSVVATQPQRAATDLHGAGMDHHRATTDTHSAVVSQSEPLVLRVNSNEVSHVSPASATTVPEPSAHLGGSPSSDASLTDQINTHAHVYSGQTSLNTAPTAPSGCLDSSIIHGQTCSPTSGSSWQFVVKPTAHLPTDKHWGMVPSGSPFVTVSPESVQHEPGQPGYHLIQPTECGGAVLEVAKEVSELAAADPGGSGNSSTSPHSRCDLELQQSFFPENIPREPGKVKKMQDINKAGQVIQDEEADDSVLADLCQEAPATLFDVSSESQLLGQLSAHPQTTALSHSHSCMELCTQEDDNRAVGSLYERENIPPGIVLRTKQEIEGRQRGEGDRELFDSSHPLLRASSLKHQRGLPHSKYTQNRRSSGPILSLQEGQSGGHDQSIGLGEIQQTDLKKLETSQSGHMKDKVMPDTSELDNTFETEVMLGQISTSIQLPELPSCGLVAAPAQGSQTNVQGSDNHPPGDSAYSQHHHVATDTDNQPRARGNIDSETLALIREIGSALLMSPTSQQFEEDADDSRPCSNMVRYLVRQIEQQTKIASPWQTTVVACPRSGSSEFGDSRKTIVTRDEASPGALSPITSPTRARQLIDLVPATAPCTAPPPGHPVNTQSTPSLHPVNTQSKAAQGFTETQTPCQNTDDPSQMNSVRKIWDVAATSHGLVDAPSLVLESQRNVVPQVLPLHTAQPAISPRSELVVSPSSHSRSSQHDPTETSVVRHLAERFEPKSPEPDRSESTPDHSLRFNYSHGSLSSQCPETSQIEDSHVPARSLEDSSHHSSLSGSQLSSSDHHLSSSDHHLSSPPSSPARVPVTTSTSSHFLTLSGQHTSLLSAQNQTHVVHTDSK